MNLPGRRFIRIIIPARIRTIFHKAFQKLIWNIYYPSYIKVVSKGLFPDNDLITKLIFGWGNQGFSARLDFLQEVIKEAFEVKEDVLECGTGLSTMLLVPIMRGKHIKVYSLEHIPFWADKVRNELRQFDLDSDGVLDSPLIDNSQYEWYEQNNLDGAKFGLVICDGPPGSAKGGRSGLMIEMNNRFASRCRIMMDDTDRKEERQIIADWQWEYPISVTKDKGNYMVLEFKV